MNKFITLTIYFGNHLILLVDASVPVAHILLRLIGGLDTIIRTCIATMWLTTSS